MAFRYTYKTYVYGCTVESVTSALLIISLQKTNTGWVSFSRKNEHGFGK
jgi:hypothetical protein